jgi:hypothetical protein
VPDVHRIMTGAIDFDVKSAVAVRAADEVR